MQWKILKVDETGSTNDDVKKAAESGEPEGLVVWALRQNSGRGRRGRHWSSPEGNLYFSILLRPQITRKNFWRYSFIAALAVYEVVQHLLPASKIELKWPNDVLIGGKKVSGILLEGGDDWLVIGIGLNIAHVPEKPLYPVTSLSAEKAPNVSLEVLLNQLLNSLDQQCYTADQKGFNAVRKAWLCVARKGYLRVSLPSGDIEGQFLDLDEEGNLCITLQDGTLFSVSTGDVFFGDT